MVRLPFCVLLFSLSSTVGAFRKRPSSDLRAVNTTKSGTSDCGPTPDHGDAHKTYLAWLDNAPCEASTQAQLLAARADELAKAGNEQGFKPIGDADVIVAGSSYLDRYFVGFNMILSRVNGEYVNVKRFSGASSGANAPFDMLLMGEVPALTKSLTYGLLGERWRYVRLAGVANQSFWFESIDWTFTKYATELPKLNEKMYVWMSCANLPCDSWFGCGDSKMAISTFDDAEVAKKAYRATGSVYPKVDVDEQHQGCTDGGVGKVFTDGQHAQITVSPTTALGRMGALTGYTIKEYADGVKAGQDAAVEFLKNHNTQTSAVILCAPGSDCKDPVI